MKKFIFLHRRSIWSHLWNNPLFLLLFCVFQVSVVFQRWTSGPEPTSTTPSWSPACWWLSSWVPFCPASWFRVTAAAAPLTGQGDWEKTQRRLCPTLCHCGPSPSSTGCWTGSRRYSKQGGLVSDGSMEWRETTGWACFFFVFFFTDNYKYSANKCLYLTRRLGQVYLLSVGR